ncbi:DUF4350 domain-containing protein [Nocardioides sp.]|uniref:DUF4350 domain-containing protein n=1 Tax=Nocardioides sp. TaxID=35761 RepID=UPI0035271F95
MSAVVSTPAARRLRTPILIGVVLLLAAAAVALLGGRVATSTPLDPDNPARTGAQAVRRVLEQQGVDVTVVRSAAAFDETEIGAGTTVLVTSAGNLGGDTTERLWRHSATGYLVLVDPPRAVAEVAGVPEGAPDFVGGAVAADCADPDVTDLTISGLQGTSYPTTLGCFPTQGGYLLAKAPRRVTVLGAPWVLANGTITDADNAALALRLLGGHRELVWYVPDAADVPAGEGVGVGELIPDWVSPGLWLLGVTVVGLMLWRGRRLGPLASEPLPVTVTAIESTLSHGRLYRRARDRAHAAGVLREASRVRLTEQLALPGRLEPTTLAQVLSSRTGRPTAELQALLDPSSPPPPTDRDLVELATRLAELEREVRRP